jgi:hypothetical protein
MMKKKSAVINQPSVSDMETGQPAPADLVNDGAAQEPPDPEENALFDAVMDIQDVNNYDAPGDDTIILDREGRAPPPVPEVEEKPVPIMLSLSREFERLIAMYGAKEASDRAAAEWHGVVLVFNKAKFASAVTGLVERSIIDGNLVQSYVQDDDPINFITRGIEALRFAQEEIQTVISLGHSLLGYEEKVGPGLSKSAAGASPTPTSAAKPAEVELMKSGGIVFDKGMIDAFAVENVSGTTIHLDSGRTLVSPSGWRFPVGTTARGTYKKKSTDRFKGGDIFVKWTFYSRLTNPGFSVPKDGIHQILGSAILVINEVTIDKQALPLKSLQLKLAGPNLRAVWRRDGTGLHFDSSHCQRDRDHFDATSLLDAVVDAAAGA